MLIRPMMLRATVAASASALVFSAAGTGWTIAGDGKSASYTTSAGDSAVRGNVNHTAGPAAVQFTPSGIGTAFSGNQNVGLADPTATLDTVSGAASVRWKNDGTIIVAGSIKAAAGASTRWGNGDKLILRLNSAGTSLDFVLNGSTVSTQAVTAVNRAPVAFVQNQAAWSVAIDGAPAGETAW